LATAVITTCLSPITSTDSATRCGSPQSSSFGRPVFTAQKRQPRVHVSPSIMKVAVCRSLQHSCKLGHFASSQTVFNRFSRINFLSLLYESIVLILIFNQSGFLSIVFVLLFVIITLFDSCLSAFLFIVPCFCCIFRVTQMNHVTPYNVGKFECFRSNMYTFFK